MKRLMLLALAGAAAFAQTPTVTAVVNRGSVRAHDREHATKATAPGSFVMLGTGLSAMSEAMLAADRR